MVRAWYRHSVLVNASVGGRATRTKVRDHMMHQVQVVEYVSKEGLEIVDTPDWRNVGVLEDAVLGVHFRKPRAIQRVAYVVEPHTMVKVKPSIELSYMMKIAGSRPTFASHSRASTKLVGTIPITTGLHTMIRLWGLPCQFSVRLTKLMAHDAQSLETFTPSYNTCIIYTPALIALT